MTLGIHTPKGKAHDIHNTEGLREIMRHFDFLDMQLRKPRDDMCSADALLYWTDIKRSAMLIENKV